VRLFREPFQHKRIVAIGCGVLALGAIIYALTSNFGRQYTGSVAARLSMGSRPVDVLLIANNARSLAADKPLGLGSAAGQADVILLARLDPATHTIYAITIPRDALIAQPSWHNSVPKIKTLFFMGDEEAPPHGPEYLAKAVSRLTGLPVDGYIAANFAGFTKAVDLVGGLTVDVKARIYDPHNSQADFRPGVQHMSGAQALAFIRVRQNEAGNSYRIDDFQRMQAEVQVLGLLRNKLLDPAHASTLVPKFVEGMKKDVATNLPQDEIVRIGIAMVGAPVYQVPIGSIGDSMVLASTSINGINKEGRIDEAAYDVLDLGYIQKQLAQFGSKPPSDGLPSPPRPDSVRIQLFGSAHMALHLAHLGFKHVVRAGGPTGANEVIYPRMRPETGWFVARAVGTGNIYVTPGDGNDVIVRE
jgi:LCP family protein required for cell wall assembly